MSKKDIPQKQLIRDKKKQRLFDNVGSKLSNRYN